MENLLTALEYLAVGLVGGIGIASMVMWFIQSKAVALPPEEEPATEPWEEI